MVYRIKRAILENSLVKTAVLKTRHLEYGREIIARWISDAKTTLSYQEAIHILDLGCGGGDDLENAKNALRDMPVSMHGLDFTDRYCDSLKGRNITLKIVDIESEKIPFDNGFFDIVIGNQILEHTKNIFFIFHEAHRVLKNDGIFIIGVPNLAALHNRILLLLGEQPSCIHVNGPHLRGFTYRELKDFAECGGYFSLEQWRGSHVYPFPFTVSVTLARLFPGLSTAIFLFLRKHCASGEFLDTLREKKYATNYSLGSH